MNDEVTIGKRVFIPQYGLLGVVTERDEWTASVRLDNGVISRYQASGLVKADDVPLPYFPAEGVV